jgi:hypothetical protein
LGVLIENIDIVIDASILIPGTMTVLTRLSMPKTGRLNITVALHAYRTTRFLPS